MEKIAYIINGREGKAQSLSMVIEGKPYNLASSHISFNLVLEELKKTQPDGKKIIRLMNKAQALKEYSNNTVVQQGDKFYYQGQQLRGVLVERIQSFMKQNVPWKFMFRFLQNLVQNPCANSREYVYTFLENEDLSLTPDGCFLGYKGAQADFWSKQNGHHTMLSGKQSDVGKLFYGKGQKLRVPWDEVVSDPNIQCARGIHVGSFNYASNWAGSDGALVLVKVNPKDVVSVPYGAKEVMRVCALEVVNVLPVHVALKQAFEPQYGEKGDEEIEASYYNVRDKKGRFIRAKARKR